MLKKSKSLLGEFKTFVLRGNVIDLAVGIIIGGAFQKIVTSFVGDLVMPFLSLITGKINMNDRFIVLSNPNDVPVTSLEQAKADGLATFNYGAFLTGVLDFLIVAIVIFFMIKFINKLHELGKKEEPKKEEAPPAPTTKTCPYCFTEIHIQATRCPHCTSKLDE